MNDLEKTAMQCNAKSNEICRKDCLGRMGKKEGQMSDGVVASRRRKRWYRDGYGGKIKLGRG
jgi:hypothetical protein